MIRLARILPFALTATALMAAGCSPDSAPTPDANAKKEITACLSVGGEAASTTGTGVHRVEANESMVVCELDTREQRKDPRLLFPILLRGSGLAIMYRRDNERNPPGVVPVL